jgi:hypothetical protein
MLSVLVMIADGLRPGALGLLLPVGDDISLPL